MQLRVWTKTLLTIQKYLPRICNSIDACIDKKANASFYVSSKNLFKNSCESVSNWIIDLSERKVNLINLSVICVDALKKMNKLYAKILALKYFDRLEGSTIMSLLGLSARTYYRKLNLAYDEMEEIFYQSGYSGDYFEKLTENEGWIIDVYYEIERMQLAKAANDNVITFSPYYINKICAGFSRVAR